MIVCVGGGILSQSGGSTYGNVFLAAEGSNITVILGSDALLHHEQIHAQQWAQFGLNFLSRYANELIVSNIKYNDVIQKRRNSNPQFWSVWDRWPPGPLPGDLDPGCFNKFEIEAGLEDGGYCTDI